jgi:hypothetical protein
MIFTSQKKGTFSDLGKLPTKIRVTNDQLHIILTEK